MKESYKSIKTICLHHLSAVNGARVFVATVLGSPYPSNRMHAGGRMYCGKKSGIETVHPAKRVLPCTCTLNWSFLINWQFWAAGVPAARTPRCVFPLIKRMLAWLEWRHFASCRSNRQQLSAELKCSLCPVFNYAWIVRNQGSTGIRYFFVA